MIALLTDSQTSFPIKWDQYCFSILFGLVGINCEFLLRSYSQHLRRINQNLFVKRVVPKTGTFCKGNDHSIVDFPSNWLRNIL